MGRDGGGRVSGPRSTGPSPWAAPFEGVEDPELAEGRMACVAAVDACKAGRPPRTAAAASVCLVNAESASPSCRDPADCDGTTVGLVPLLECATDSSSDWMPTVCL